MPPAVTGSLPSGWPDNSHSPSLSSSFSSESAAFDMLPQYSSQSDILSSDHSAFENTPLPAPVPRHAKVHDLALAAPRPRSSSLAAVMGQNYSKSSPVSFSSSLGQKGISLSAAAANTGFKLKRAFAARRKKSEDATKLFAGSEKGKEKEKATVQAGASQPSPSSLPGSTVTPTQVTLPPSKPARSPKLNLHLATQVFAGGRKVSKSGESSPVPPPVPPKPSALPGSASSSTSITPPPLSQPSSVKDQAHLKTEYRGSIIPISPGISSAVNFMRMDEEQREQEQERLTSHARENERAVDRDQKEGWRKSDSTMSHHTIRPGAAFNTRTSRPVSMAESLQSNHTIVPVNKRLSALLTDAEYETPEEDDSSFKSASEELTPVTQIAPAKASTSHVKNRRSMSLNLGSSNTKVTVSPPASSAGSFDMKYPSKTLPETNHRIPSSHSSETPTLTRAAANGIIAPSSSGVQSTGNNIRGRLAAWTATNHSVARPSPVRGHPRQNAPPSAYHRSTPSPQPHLPAQRIPAISITSGLAPAAGLAKRAVEKMGRAWGGFSSSSSSSGYSSSSSSAGHSSSDHALGRTHSNNSGGVASSGKGKSRRTPDAPSGAWSVSSSGGNSLSDSDAFVATSGPSLGRRVRGPMRANSGAAAIGGVVFGRELSVVVRETAVGVGIPDHLMRRSSESTRAHVDADGKDGFRALEQRALPAVVVRCAQHILLWGVGEEGLFRVSGRPSHVSKLRQEFDTGADFDMQACSPGDLDPHAVASIFKAFLRELPEPILTHSLIPYFDAALSQENALNAQEETVPLKISGRGPTLPSGPRSGVQSLRKPPSLSTLAMPNFSGMRPPSRSLINALKSLISQLPLENKDLIRTVTELIRATARESRQTKMPLSNLLLVFCPSLSMNPPLLRVLCECDEIWKEPSVESPVLDIKRESLVLDISAPSSAVEVDDDNEHFSDASDSLDKSEDAEEEEEDSDNEARRPVQERLTSKEDLNARMTVNRPKPMGPRRAQIPVMDGNIGADPAMILQPGSPTALSIDSVSLPDEVSSYASTSESRSIPSPFECGGALSSPPFSSSLESLPTPSTSSAAPSLAHLPLEKDLHFRTDAPRIVDDDILTPRNFISDGHFTGSVEFPAKSGGSPTTPMSPIRPPVLSLPSLLANPAAPSPTSPLARRTKKPSLQLLFSKRSASPLSSGGKPFISSPYLQAPRAASDSSISTPSSAKTAPQSSTFTLPPKIDTPIESSPLRFGLGFDPESPQRSPRTPEPEKDHCQDCDGQDQLSLEISSPDPQEEMPIANRYCTPSSSTLSLTLTNTVDTPPSHLRTRPTLRTRQSSKSSILSTASSNHLGLLDDDEDQEDWTKSVLLAADAKGQWDLS